MPDDMLAQAREMAAAEGRPVDEEAARVGALGRMAGKLVGWLHRRPNWGNLEHSVRPTPPIWETRTLRILQKFRRDLKPGLNLGALAAKSQWYGLTGGPEHEATRRVAELIEEHPDLWRNRDRPPAFDYLDDPRFQLKPDAADDPATAELKATGLYD